MLSPLKGFSLAHSSLRQPYHAESVSNYNGIVGTAAESAISGWTEVLKARAVADQAMKLLEAHASAQAASVC